MIDRNLTNVNRNRLGNYLAISVGVLLLSILAPNIGYSESNCLKCHPKTKVSEESVHSELSCTECHLNIELSTHPRETKPLPEWKLCTQCHKKSATEIAQSVHVGLLCRDCHGSPHETPVPARFKPMIPRACGNCHEEVFREYNLSIHWEAYRSGNDDAPLCTDCHSNHLIKASADTTSPIFPVNIPSTCTVCHDDKRITTRYGLPSARLSTYLKSYHGIALRSGIFTAATCVSCHNAHLVLPSSDKRSPTNTANLVKTCGKCHPRATATFVKGKIHVEPRPEVSPGVFAVRSFYTIFIGLLMFFFILHILMDFKKRFGQKEV